MRTLYYVNAASWFGFYLDEGALALANDGARFNSFSAVLAWAGEHDFEFVAKCEPEGSARVATEMRRNGGGIWAKLRSQLTVRASGTPVLEAGRASFDAVSMSGSCKVVWRTRPTIGWNCSPPLRGCGLW
jgi:hypothetical protein